ncbi:MAG: UDP-N-acetylmuramoyl-L-alanine--D-glutamate ligase [Bacteroidota bacterium]
MSKKLIILGGGESGIGAALLGRQQGYDVFVSDGGKIKEMYKTQLRKAGVEFEEGGHSSKRILEADEIMKSPGIPEKTDIMKAIRKKGIEVISEFELAYRFKGDSKIVGITGSNGKSTTTALLYHICHTAGLDCALVGNIGYSIAKQMAEDPKPLYIAEISSFQLDDIKTFRPDIAILVNITEDHLDRYDYNFENYIHSKFRIIEHQSAGDIFIYCADDPVTMQYLPTYLKNSKTLPFSMKEIKTEGAYIKDEEMLIRYKNEEMRMSINDFAVQGRHNQYNSMAAGIAAATLEIRDNNIREAMETFEGLPHRNEPIATIKGVEYINDSKATNMNSTWYALEKMKRPTILILGGVDKGNDYGIIEELVAEKVKAIICLGVDNEKIHAAFKDKVAIMIDTNSAKDAAKAAYRLAEKGDAVLLSPGCASFDLFLNYEDRGNQFKQAVKDL